MTDQFNDDERDAIVASGMKIWACLGRLTAASALYTLSMVVGSLIASIADLRGGDTEEVIEAFTKFVRDHIADGKANRDARRRRH